jgi:hypothetical protein
MSHTTGNNSAAETFDSHAKTNAAFGFDDSDGIQLGRRASSAVFDDASAGGNGGKCAARWVSRLRAHAG